MLTLSWYFSKVDFVIIINVNHIVSATYFFVGMLLITKYILDKTVDEIIISIVEIPIKRFLANLKDPNISIESDYSLANDTKKALPENKDDKE